MSPDTIEAVRCALQTVCETGGTMDELALIEQADRIADLESRNYRLESRLNNLHEAMLTQKGAEIRKLEQQLAEYKETQNPQWIKWCDELQAKHGDLEAENERLENLLAEGVHSCSQTCKRPMCVLRREKAELEAEIMSLNNVVGLTENERDAAQAENAKLWSEQHEGQRVYRRLLAELEEQRAINEELREASKTTALEIYRHSAMGGSEEGFLSYWASAVGSRMQLLKEQDK